MAWEAESGFRQHRLVDRGGDERRRFSRLAGTHASFDRGSHRAGRCNGGMSGLAADFVARVDDRLAEARQIDPGNDGRFAKKLGASDQMQRASGDLTGERGPGLDGDLRTDARRLALAYDDGKL